MSEIYPRSCYCFLLLILQISLPLFHFTFIYDTIYGSLVNKPCSLKIAFGLPRWFILMLAPKFAETDGYERQRLLTCFNTGTARNKEPSTSLQGSLSNLDLSREQTWPPRDWHWAWTRDKGSWAISTSKRATLTNELYFHLSYLVVRYMLVRIEVLTGLRVITVFNPY